MHLEMFNWTEFDRLVLCAQNYTTSIGKLHYFQIDRYPFLSRFILIELWPAI